MRQILFIAVLLAVLPGMANAQKYFTKNGNISFFSKTPMENISADNNQVLSVINPQNGEFNFSLLIVNFHFKKALMEEHFNENYLESDKYPKATFKGTFADPSKVDFTKDGSYPVTVNGDLTIHGVTKKLSAPGTITVKGGKISVTAKFPVKPADHNIAIPKLMKDNIADAIDVTVACDYPNKM